MSTGSNLLDALELDALKPEEQEEILDDIGEIIAEGTMTRLMEQMDDATSAEFTKLLESEASEEQVDAFIKEHVPNSEQILQDTIDELQDDILAVTSK